MLQAATDPVTRGPARERGEHLRACVSPMCLISRAVLGRVLRRHCIEVIIEWCCAKNGPGQEAKLAPQGAWVLRDVEVVCRCEKVLMNCGEDSTVSASRTGMRRSSFSRWSSLRHM